MDKEPVFLNALLVSSWQVVTLEVIRIFKFPSNQKDLEYDKDGVLLVKGRKNRMLRGLNN